MQCVTAVDALWLAELGPMFFSVKEKGGYLEKRRRDLRDAERMEEELRRASEKRVVVEEKPTPRSKILTPGVKTPMTRRDTGTPMVRRRFGL